MDIEVFDKNGDLILRVGPDGSPVVDFLVDSRDFARAMGGRTARLYHKHCKTYSGSILPLVRLKKSWDYPTPGLFYSPYITVILKRCQ
jgi:hypothetical protein